MGERAGDFFFTLSLFLLFLVVGLGVVALGADIYRDTAAAMTKNYDMRTSVLYIEEKIRQNPGGVTLAPGPQGQALVLSESYEAGDYETWLFWGEGKLREVTVASGSEVNPGDGQAIMDLASLDFAATGDLLAVSLATEDGVTFNTYINWEGAAP